MTVSPELLAAYADGELEAEAAQAVEAEIAESPDLQAKLAAHRALRDRLALHFAPMAEQPVPERLQRAVFADRESRVVDFRTHARLRRMPAMPMRWIRIAGPALAASLVLALVGIGLSPSGDYARGDLAEALESQLVATQAADAPVRVLLSFRDHGGEYCRGFTGKVRSGIACRDHRGWRLRKLLGPSRVGPNEYQQAGSVDMTLMAAAQEMAAGPALDAAEEALAASGGWRGTSSR